MFKKVGSVISCKDGYWFNKKSSPELHWWFDFIIHYDSKYPHLAKREELWKGAVEV